MKYLGNLYDLGDFLGELCELPCDRDPCENGATCENTRSNRAYKCHCADGYTGKHCDQGTIFYNLFIFKSKLEYIFGKIIVKCVIFPTFVCSYVVYPGFAQPWKSLECKNINSSTGKPWNLYTCLGKVLENW